MDLGFDLNRGPSATHNDEDNFWAR